ncbi:heat shock protein 90-5, chloroplastic-like [Quercus robur]|uniref:heat shock protein 90-5, chloroplastic-like n=1 Tax=Quercus robur TaxID=38942 RepID=UPI002162F571|nr:heat shock protein 90-5, chloroplastic-like [Quercus robur]
MCSLPTDFFRVKLDTGIGMTKEELIDCLGTIAQNGTSKFLKALKENRDLGADNGLIGQFGVGFYSAFLVAEKVVVSTKIPRSDKQYVWESVANSSSYMIEEETDPEKFLRRGTQITLYLRGHDKYEFSDPARIQGLVKNYSQFVSFPIYTWQEKSRTVEVRRLKLFCVSGKVIWEIENFRSWHTFVCPIVKQLATCFLNNTQDGS